MKIEMLKTFDENGDQIGVATREEVHRLGYWHEVFHCWFVGREEDKSVIYLQLRSDQKQDYPNLLDITAAGHLMVEETVADGIREIKEEIGIDVSYDELEALGTLMYSVEREGFIDREIANLFLYKYDQTFEDFSLQQEEVSGIFKAYFKDFYELWSGKINEINIVGFQIDSNGTRVDDEKNVNKRDFVPHETSFYQSVLHLIKAALDE